MSFGDEWLKHRLLFKAPTSRNVLNTANLSPYQISNPVEIFAYGEWEALSISTNWKLSYPQIFEGMMMNRMNTTNNDLFFVKSEAIRRQFSRVTQSLVKTTVESFHDGPKIVIGGNAIHYSIS